MTPFLAELERQLHGAAAREVASGQHRRSAVLRHRLGAAMRAAPVFAGAGLAVLVFVLALTTLHSGRADTHAATTSSTHARPLPVGAPVGPTHPIRDAADGQIEQDTLKIVASSADPRGGLPWAVESFRMTGGQTCVLAGREQGGRIGLIGEDGLFHNDGRFHPYTRYTVPVNCDQTDGSGHAFIAVSNYATPTSGNDQDLIGTAPPAGCRSSSGEPRVARSGLCPKIDERGLEYGLLGPEATSVTSIARGRAITVPTGLDGAFIVVGPPANTRFAGSVSPSVSAGLVVAVHYRDGLTCRPRRLPTRHDCAPVGYVAPTSVSVTGVEVRAPITATVVTATRWCSNRAGHYIACDGRVPPGYSVLPGPAAGEVLLQWSWIARVAASGKDAGYEYAITGGPPCGGGQSSSGPIPARVGERIVEQSLGASACAQRDTVRVEYRTNVGPGGASFADPPNPGHDGQPLVGSTTIYVPR